jgi:hypothetical protein
MLCSATKPLLIFFLLATAGWLLYPNDQPVRAKKVIPWRQPATTFESFPLTIAPYLTSQQVVRRSGSQKSPAQTWVVDFDVFERQFAKSLPPGKELVLDDNLLRQFEGALQGLTSSLPSESVERIAFLFGKSFPSPTGEQLAALFGPIYHYHTQKDAAAARLAELYPPGSLELTEGLLNSTEALQRKYFSNGQVEQLFGNKNAVNRYLLQRRLVRENPRLSPEEKRVALLELQNSFKVAK